MDKVDQPEEGVTPDPPTAVDAPGNGSSETSVSSPAAPPAEKAPSRTRLFFRSALRWFLGLSVVALTGALLVFILLYVPTSQRLQSTLDELTQNYQLIGQKDEQIASLEAHVGRLSGDLSTANLRSAFLQAELDVLEAGMAVSENNFSRASLAADRADHSLQSLAALLTPEQVTLLNDIRARLGLAKGKMQPTLKNALPDLRTLSGDLALLKSTVVK